MMYQKSYRYSILGIDPLVLNNLFRCIHVYIHIQVQHDNQIEMNTNNILYNLYHRNLLGMDFRNAFLLFSPIKIKNKFFKRFSCKSSFQFTNPYIHHYKDNIHHFFDICHFCICKFDYNSHHNNYQDMQHY